MLFSWRGWEKPTSCILPPGNQGGKDGTRGKVSTFPLFYSYTGSRLHAYKEDENNLLNLFLGSLCIFRQW